MNDDETKNVIIIGSGGREHAIASKMGESPEFTEMYNNLSEKKQRILNGELELYVGHSYENAKHNVAYARNVIGGRK